MNKADSVLVKVFLYGLPVIAVFGIFSYSYNTGIIDHTTGTAQFFNKLAGLLYATWMTLSIVISIRLMVSGSFRDQVLSRFTCIRERDEREAMLTGKATKTTFLTTLAILMFLFCLSCFQVSIYRVPPEKAVGGKTGFVTLGLTCNLLENSNRAGAHNDEFLKQDIFTYSGLPISSTAIILGLFIWQICSYNITMRRLANKH
jgi:preprotein translocase subunit SecG